MEEEAAADGSAERNVNGEGSDEKSEDKKSPSQGAPRRRAVDTSDLRSCALVQTKLKTHRSSWKSIDGTPL